MNCERVPEIDILLGLAHIRHSLALVDEETSMVIQKAIVENWDGIRLSQETPDVVESVSMLGRFLVSLGESADQVQNLEKDVHFITDVGRKTDLYVHAFDDKIYSAGPGGKLDFNVFLRAKYIIVGPLHPTPTQLQNAHVVPSMRIRLEESRLDGQPIKLTFRVTNSDYWLSDGYSIKYCIRLQHAGALHIK